MSTDARLADLSFLRRSSGRPLSALLGFVHGLRGRLLLAFIAISLFVVVAAAAGLYALGEVEQSLARTQTAVPVALDARELWRKSEKIIGVGPALVNASNKGEAEALSSRLRDELGDTSTILARLRDSSLDLDPLNEIEDLMIWLNKNLDRAWVAWSDGMAAADHKGRIIGEALTASRQFGNIWRARFADFNTKMDRQQRAMTSAGAGLEEGLAARDQFDKARVTLLALDELQRDAGNAFELINRAANAPDTAGIDKIEAQAQELISAIGGRVSDFDPEISLELSAPLGELRRAVIGDASIFTWIRRAIEAKRVMRLLIAEDEALSIRLKAAVDQLVATSQGEIASANTEAARTSPWAKRPSRRRGAEPGELLSDRLALCRTQHRLAAN
jgi:hypothetical protein